MKARPILFSSPMIRALLESRKTQTRRAVKPLTKTHPIKNLAEHGRDGRGYTGIFNDPTSWGFPYAEDGEDMALADWVGCLCQYGKPGDLLWVRESITTRDKGDGLVFDQPFYRADVTDPYGFCFTTDDGPRYVEQLKWTPSIHMPRAASRLTLRITDVRVQRLQDISEADAHAEGCAAAIVGNRFAGYATSYAKLWESINGPGSWTENPWCWAVSFEVIKQNVDRYFATAQAVNSDAA